MLHPFEEVKLNILAGDTCLASIVTLHTSKVAVRRHTEHVTRASHVARHVRQPGTCKPCHHGLCIAQLTSQARSQIVRKYKNNDNWPHCDAPLACSSRTSCRGPLAAANSSCCACPCRLHLYIALQEPLSNNAFTAHYCNRLGVYKP